MTHWKTLTLAAVAQIGLAAAAGANDLPATTINVVGNLGITTQSRQLEAPFWTDEIVQASGGALTVNFRPWNELGMRGPEVFELLGDGVMNIATAQLGHHTGSDPINDGNDLAGLSADFAMFRGVSDAFFPVLAAYYRENLGLHLLSLQSFQDQVLYCRAPISGLSDLQGRRIRGSGASQSDFLSYFGATGVDMAFGDVQPALEQGVIDCAITGTLGGYSARWYESATHLYTLPINFGAGATAANAEWWDALDPAVQTFLTEQVHAWSDRAWALNASEDTIGVLCNTTGPCELGAPGGMVLVEPTEADAALRTEALMNAVLPGWISRCGDICTDAFNTTIASVAGLRIE
jgi:TRAP-type C4-dicarboxylate transport system substrate-binding protein